VIYDTSVEPSEINMERNIVYLTDAKFDTMLLRISEDFKTVAFTQGKENYMLF
jgi:hypothetical protein